MEKIIFYLLLFFVITSCKNNNNSSISTKTDISPVLIKKVDNDRGILSFDGKFFLHSSCQLIYSDSFPKWIKDNNSPEYSFKKYKFKPYISDIEEPFIFFKHKYEPFFYIVKYNDTLKFKLEGN